MLSAIDHSDVLVDDTRVITFSFVKSQPQITVEYINCGIICLIANPIR